jgi:hypothetical protein
MSALWWQDLSPSPSTHYMSFILSANSETVLLFGTGVFYVSQDALKPKIRLLQPPKSRDYKSVSPYWAYLSHFGKGWLNSSLVTIPNSWIRISLLSFGPNKHRSDKTVKSNNGNFLRTARMYSPMPQEELASVCHNWRLMSIILVTQEIEIQRFTVWSQLRQKN